MRHFGVQSYAQLLFLSVFPLLIFPVKPSPPSPWPPQATVPPKVARQTTNAGELRLLTTAALISGLKEVKGPMTRLIVMDKDGGEGARALARALTLLNQPLSYVMAGGFKGWRDDAGLPIVEAANYTADAGALIADNVEVVVGKVQELSKPQIAVPLVGGAVLGTAAVVNYHTTLEYIGVLGVLLTITNKALSYSSPQEALDDVAAVAGKVTNAVGAAGKLLPKGGVAAPKLPSIGLPKPGGQVVVRAPPPPPPAAAAAPAAARSPPKSPPSGEEGGIKEGAISDVMAAADEGGA